MKFDLNLTKIILGLEVTLIRR